MMPPTPADSGRSLVRCRVDETDWRDSLVWQGPRKSLTPAVKPGKVSRIQLWMLPADVRTAPQLQRSARVLREEGPLYEVTGSVNEAAMERPSVERGLGYLLVDVSFPVILIIRNATHQEVERLRGMNVAASGVLQASISIWHGPFMSPVDVRVERVDEASGGDRVIEATPMTGVQPYTSVDWLDTTE